jgi:cell wall-associated NlpC family hydrolase
MTFPRFTRIMILALAALVIASAPADASRKKKKKPAPRYWAASSIATVVKTGALPDTTTATFRPRDPLDGPTLQVLLSAAFPKGARRVRAIPEGQPVTIGDLNAAFVRAAGMAPTARRAEALIAQAGYEVRPGLGNEIVARLLRLRTNLPQHEDMNERAWYQEASRADAAWTTAQVLNWGGWEKGEAMEVVELLGRLPQTTGTRHEVIQRAFDYIGMPYVWGGMSEKPQSLFGRNVAGGFDCSGFLWRVMALDGTSPRGIDRALGGRTTFQMAATTPRAQRIARDRIQPTDIILQGPGGLGAASGGLNHVGMAISAELQIHTSGQGTALIRYDKGYYHGRFAFGKRIIPE